jgi:aldehyde:ferredoxin oxidoreductase
VAVKGKAGNVPLFNADQAKEYRRTYLAQLTGHFDLLKEFGTPGIMAVMAKFGDSPVKNWASTAPIDFPNVESSATKT